MRASHKNKNKSKKKNKFLVLTLYLISLIVVLGGVFFFAYRYVYNNSSSNFKNMFVTEIKTITDINEKVESLLDINNNIYEENSKKVLPDLRDQLLDELSKLQKSNVPNEFGDSYNYLVNGLDYNIKIFKEMIFILNNTKSNRLQNSLENLKTYRTKCRDNYSLVNFEGIHVFLPKVQLEYIEGILKFGNQASKNYEEEQFIKNQESNFYNEVTELQSSFINIYDNRVIYKTTFDEDSITEEKFDELIDSVNKDNAEIQKLILTLNDIKAPKSGTNLYNSLKSMLENYRAYLQCYKHALSTSKNLFLSGNFNKESITPLFDDCDVSLKKAEDMQIEFNKLLTEFKNNL